ncbi:MAG: GNAT family N-acetyltransferase [Cyanobacteria bacterium P01_H01_bin.121]
MVTATARIEEQAALKLRQATIADIPFLARIVYEASLPPLNHCFWDDLLHDMSTTSVQFIEAMLQADASNWGGVEDFFVLTEHDRPVAAAAGYSPSPDNYCPLRLENLDQLAAILNWSPTITQTFRDRYTQLWGGNFKPEFFKPIAPWIIETVAVVPEARGRGLVKVLLRGLLDAGRSQGHERAGIMVINGNDAAYRAYTSLGFKPYQTFHTDYFAGLFQLEFPGITKLGLSLA